MVTSVVPSQSAPSIGEQVTNGVKVLAELALLPGSSQIVEGKVGAGILYGVAGFAAKAVFGPLGWIVAGLDSYSVSASGQHLWQFVTKRPGQEKAAETGKAE
jgi:hypothetical protein